MSILPKFIYLFQCIPLKVPMTFFKDLDKAISLFLWRKKVPRVKLLTLQAPYAKGGLNLPNFRVYYLASQFRTLWMWTHSNDNNVRWVSIEQQELKFGSLAIIPFLSSKKQLSTITSNPLILATYNAWFQLHAFLNLNIQLLVNTPFKDNPSIPQPIADGILQTWVRKGIRLVRDLYTNNVFASFDQLSEFYDLHRHSFFKYLQIRHWIKSQSLEIFPDKPEETLLESCLLDPKRITTKGLISCVYRMVLDSSPTYNKYSTKSKWESDLNCKYDDKNWSGLLNSSQTILISTKHRQIQFNIFHRTYYTPYRLNKMNANITNRCHRCKTSVGDLLHMLWNCVHLQIYWNNVILITSTVCGLPLDPDPRIWILGDYSALLTPHPTAVLMEGIAMQT
uniref:Reverse transcriptase zinc-binding domain-containing protein n=1 Tax=Poecilia latipinna TaxID=48699 RepID=A0A3B3V2X0_9TELE